MAQLSLGRRRLLQAMAGAAPLGLAACGFHPLYMAGQGQTDSAAAKELAAIHVYVFGERINQLMQLALEDQLDRFGIAAPKRYDLIAPLNISGEGVGIDQFTDTTRIRYVGSVPWVLRRRDVGKTTVRSGIVRVIDGVNVIGSQFFNADQETDTEFRAFARNLADQVVLQLATYFDEQARIKPA